MTAYYNELDPFAAVWLRELIKAGAIAPGDVDERDIREVRPGDLKGYAQCHFFAGIGGWSQGLRLAGWEDDRPVWTGSCPCQGFSSAGKGGGFSDPRHLWPRWFELIRECQPSVVFGEQVAAAIRHGWWDLVQRDLEGEGYACGMAVLGAHSVGAPHIRQRCWFVADVSAQRLGETWDGSGRSEEGDGGEYNSVADAEHSIGRAELAQHGYPHGRDGFGRSGDSRVLADSPDLRRLERRDSEGVALQGECSEREGESPRSEHVGELPGGLEGLRGDGDGGVDNPQRREEHSPAEGGLYSLPGGADADDGVGHSISVGRQQQQNGIRRSNTGMEPSTGQSIVIGETGESSFWADCRWLPCRDGKLRPVEPSIFPLAHGIRNRVGLLRGAGNAIVPQVAQAFIEAWMEHSRESISGAIHHPDPPRVVDGK